LILSYFIHAQNTEFDQNAYNPLIGKYGISWRTSQLYTQYGRIVQVGNNDKATTATSTTTTEDDIEAFQSEARSILKNIAEDIKEAFQDLRAIVVVTAVAETDAQLTLANPEAEFDEALRTKITSMALTRMEIEGDVYNLIPAKGNDPELRNELIKEHKENIVLATENWKKFIEGIVTIVEVGAEIANVNLPNIRSRRLQTFAQPPLTR
jgi:hypothetical protein